MNVVAGHDIQAEDLPPGFIAVPNEHDSSAGGIPLCIDNRGQPGPRTPHKNSSIREHARGPRLDTPEHDLGAENIQFVPIAIATDVSTIEDEEEILPVTRIHYCFLARSRRPIRVSLIGQDISYPNTDLFGPR